MNLPRPLDRISARMLDAAMCGTIFAVQRRHRLAPGSRKALANYRNGELAITADLVRTAEGLRQGVTELRQLMAWLRARGVNEFGLWACSYGGWIGALLASVERDFRFLALIEPIVDVDHAIWQSPASAALRRELRRAGIDRELPARHFPQSSPLHGKPLCGSDCVVLAAGEYDTIATATEIAELQALWPGSTLLRERQGHFGYKLMPAVWDWLLANGWLTTSPVSACPRRISFPSENLPGTLGPARSAPR